MSAYERVMVPILKALALGDTERMHWLALNAGAAVQSTELLRQLIKTAYWLIEDPVTVCGMRFPNSLGVAAGLDKNARLPALWEAAGFGFFEAGTVTPLPQRGHPRPRIFRIPQTKGIINRLGFNNAGARAVRSNLAQWRPVVSFPIGISLGKRKETPNKVSLVLADYSVLLVELYDYGDYWVINISSPNTPGLRGLQDPENVLLLVRGVVECVRELAEERGQPPKSVWVKFAPDLSDDQLIEGVHAAINGGASGVVLFNTTLNRPSSHLYHALAKEAGGYSGPQTLEYTIEKVGLVHQRFQEVPIVGVGGISSHSGYMRILAAGASLAQVHTTITYHGLGAALRIRCAV
jgi:dihydroorotate dehydrogenase